MCDFELNNQIKGLQSRLTQAETDINATYAGISQLVLALAANPLTAASVAPSAVLYNLQPFGMQLVRQLLQSLIPTELQNTMKMLTMISAASIDAAAADIVDTAAAMAVGAVNNGIDAVNAAAMDTIFATTSAIASLDTTFAANIHALTTPVTQLNYRSVAQTSFDNAYTAWYNATQALVGTYTQPQLDALNLARLKAQRALAMIDAGIGAAFLGADGSLSGVYGTVDQINSALHEVNGVLGFLTTQNDITSCKSLSVQIGAR
jgi:hypothetical protein